MADRRLDRDLVGTGLEFLGGQLFLKIFVAFGNGLGRVGLPEDKGQR